MTKDQWFEKLKSSVPSWFFELEENQKAVFYGFANQLYELEKNIDETVKETFINQSVEDFLNEHGYERSIQRISSSETDLNYRVRVRNLTNNSNKIDLKIMIDDFLPEGECLFIEDKDSRLYCDRENFVNRREFLIDIIVNAFSVVIDKILTPSITDDLLDVIVYAINKNKMFGSLYRLIYVE
jgi:hypothetical protein